MNPLQQHIVPCHGQDLSPWLYRVGANVDTLYYRRGRGVKVDHRTGGKILKWRAGGRKRKGWGCHRFYSPGG